MRTFLEGARAPFGRLKEITSLLCSVRHSGRLFFSKNARMRWLHDRASYAMAKLKFWWRIGVDEVIE
jgi:hypothetical protein